MAQFTVRGEIVPFSSNQRNIRVQNSAELKAFWQQERIDTDMNWASCPPLVTVSKQSLVSQCQIGDEVEYVIETQNRSNGRRGIRGVSIRVVSRRSEQASR